MEFKEAFAASIDRRRLSRKEVNAFMRERARVDGLYRAWIKTVSPDDVELMVVIEEAVAILEDGRARGYRTPHK